MKRLFLLAAIIISVIASAANANARPRPHHHHDEPRVVHVHKPHHHHHRLAIGTVLVDRPAHGHYMRKGRHQYWLTEHTVYRIDRVHGKKVYVVVRHLS